MASVNIIVKGIAVAYHKDDGIWRILFPFGECHLVKFKTGEDDPGIELAEEGRRIRITTEGAKSRFRTGTDYDSFLDLTAEYSHSSGIKIKDNWNEKAVLMTIKNAEYSAYEYTNDKHLMARSNRITLSPQKIAYSSKIMIEADKVIVNVDGHDDFPKVFDNDSTIIFDNDCQEGEHRKISDLEMVYNIVEDANKADEQCVVAKVSEKTGDEIQRGDFYGDPRDSFEGGLPCHVIVVSKSKNLP